MKVQCSLHCKINCNYAFQNFLSVQMPLFYQQNINPTTKLAIWHIEETEDFFSGTIPLTKQITHPHKRLQHLAGRFLLRYLFPSFPFQEIIIADTKKPFLPNDEFHFSISHCGDYAAAIVSKKNRVGIDVELVTPRIENITNKFLSENEHQIFANYYKQKSSLENRLIINDEKNNQLTLQHLTIIWSTKEAVFKWWGNGNVNFSKDIDTRLQSIEKHGNFSAKFNEQYLPINYILFNKLCLAWVTSN